MKTLWTALAGAGLFLGAWSSAANLTAQETPAAPAPAAVPAPAPAPASQPKPEDPLGRSIDSNLYLQTSAEYRAACYQAYNLAELRLAQKLAGRAPSPRCPAVVLDLDETVLDNSGFQTRQTRGGLAYDQKVWDAWESDSYDQVRLIPGAKEFICEAVRRCVTVIYISNRSNHEKTKLALQHLGLGVGQDRFLKVATTTSDKTARRKEVEQEFDVLLYVGDNLRDFDEDPFKFGKLGNSADELDGAIATRKKAVDATRSKWGDSWIILPNPAYGEWTKPLGRGAADLDRLSPKP